MKQDVKQYGKRLKTHLALSALLSVAQGANATTSEFETQFLRKDKQGVTPDVFLYHDAVTPGLKAVDLYVNDRLIGRFNLQFVDNRVKREATPCLSRPFLQTLGIRTEGYRGWQASSPNHPTDQCEDLTGVIPAAVIRYDASQQALLLQLPQEAIIRQQQVMISPDEWDDGVANLRTRYSGYFYHTHVKGSDSDNTTQQRSAWISLNSVGSIGAWRLYSNDAFNNDEDNGWQSSHDSLYLSRGIARLRGHLSAGDLYTASRSAILGTMPLRGVAFATSDRMLSDNQFDYSPVIRGVARTNARLVVRQQGSVIYSAPLTPGPFVIDDLTSARSGAELDVTIEEADGSQQQFRVPYSTLPTMIRPGAFRYSVAGGKYRENSHSASEPWLGFAGVEYGFEHFTLLATTLLAEQYRSLSAGAAWNIGPIGAFSLELAGASYRDVWDRHAEKTGSALRVLYARYIEPTNTHLQVAGYQYNSRDFIDFREFRDRAGRDEINGYDYGDDGWNRRRRTRAEITLNQGLADYGNLYLSLSQDRYYHTHEKNSSLTAGGGTRIGPASLSLSWSWNKSGPSKDNQLSLNVSVPFSGGERQNNAGSLNYGLTRNRDNHYSQTLGYAGNALENTLNYSANLQRDAGGKSSGSLSAGYNASHGSVTGSVGHSDDMTQYSAGMSGSLVLYSGGLLLAPALGDTIGIIETPHAADVRIMGNSTANTDRWGRTVVSYMTPYRYNTLTLDTRKTEGVELKASSRKVVPTQGAAVLLRFATRVGRRAMVEIRSVKPVPLGALVYAEGEKEEAGIVGRQGLAYLSGIATNGEQALRVQWGASASQQCAFLLPAATGAQNNPDNWYQKITVNCR